MNVGLIGAAGYWANNILRTLVENKEIENIVAYDINKKGLQKVKEKYRNRIEITTSYDDLLAMKLIDAVLIATPPDTHYLLAVKAIKSGKHIFVEKPVTTDFTQAYLLNELAKGQKKVLCVGHTFLYIRAISYIKNLIESGEIGDIHGISFVFKNLGKYQSAGVGVDLLPHSISLVLYLTGKRIISAKYHRKECLKKGIDDIGTLILEWKNGIADIGISWLNPCKERKMTITGSKKMVVFDDIEPLEKVKIYDKGLQLKQATSSWGESMCSYRHGDIVIPHIPAGEPLKLEIQDFIDCIKTGRKPISDGDLGLEVVRIIEEGLK